MNAILYTLPDPLPALPRGEIVYAVVQRWPGGESTTLHRTEASATGKVGGLIQRGDWERNGDVYVWTHRDGRVITIEEREVLP